MKNHFYHHTIWKSVAAFSDLFNDMKVFVYDDSRQNAIGEKDVPLILAPKEKVVSVLSVIPGTPKPEVDNYLPKMSLIWNGISFDPERMRGSKEKRKLAVELYTPETDDVESSYKRGYYDMQTIPYTLNFELTIWTKYMDEAAQLLENILPFFHPDLQVSLYERAVGTERKMKVVLDSVTPNFVYDLNEPDRRIVQFNLNFAMECNLYRPIEINEEIRKVIINVTDAASNNVNQGDLLYTTSAGISGTLDEQITNVIVAFDQIELNYTNTTIQQEIDDLESDKIEQFDLLSDTAAPSAVQTIAETYDEQIRDLAFDPEAAEFNVLQWRRSKITSLTRERLHFLRQTSSIPEDIPLYFETGYDAALEDLSDSERAVMKQAKVRYEIPIHGYVVSNKDNEFIAKLFDNMEEFLDPDIKSILGSYNFRLDES